MEQNEKKQGFTRPQGTRLDEGKREGSDAVKANGELPNGCSVQSGIITTRNGAKFKTEFRFLDSEPQQ